MKRENGNSGVASTGEASSSTNENKPGLARPVETGMSDAEAMLYVRNKESGNQYHLSDYGPKFISPYGMSVQNWNDICSRYGLDVNDRSDANKDLEYSYFVTQYYGVKADGTPNYQKVVNSWVSGYGY